MDEIKDEYVKHPKTGRLCFDGSVIDGTGLSIADYLKKMFPTPTNDIKLCVFCIQEFYKFLSIGVQTDTEEEFHKEMDKIIKHHYQN